MYKRQLPIITNGPHRNANIRKIIPDKINECFKERKVSVLAGFQGLSSDSRITTIGRGGSDNTAVFLASSLKADRCDIYTDVDGVYTSDPKMTDKVKKLDKISNLQGSVPAWLMSHPPTKERIESIKKIHAKIYHG